MNPTLKFSPDDRLLIIQEVCEVVRLSKPRIYELMQEDRFPRPVKVGRSRVAWLESEIYSYINKCLEQRDG